MFIVKMNVPTLYLIATNVLRVARAAHVNETPRPMLCNKFGRITVFPPNFTIRELILESVSQI